MRPSSNSTPQHSPGKRCRGVWKQRERERERERAGKREGAPRPSAFLHFLCLSFSSSSFPYSFFCTSISCSVFFRSFPSPPWPSTGPLGFKQCQLTNAPHHPCSCPRVLYNLIAARAPPLSLGPQKISCKALLASHACVSGTGANVEATKRQTRRSTLMSPRWDLPAAIFPLPSLVARQSLIHPWGKTGDEGMHGGARLAVFNHKTPTTRGCPP